MSNKDQQNKQLRSIGSFLIAGGLLCGLVGWERYRTATETAQAVAQAMEIEFVSVNIPTATIVCSFFAVMLMVAGIRCWISWHQSRKQSEQPELL